MSTTIRPEVSEKNKWWVERHRYYELKHFCLQYPIWKKAYASLNDLSTRPADLNDIFVQTNKTGDPTARVAIAKAFYSERIDMIERVAMETDPELASYILKGVTDGAPFNYLETTLNIPCSRDTYYDRYRKFFWLLNKARN